eukprot:CAMPEP_0169421104 /NCGR_PEP_ID=MMETSP1017-20121227/66075_1 /TAXON_ID=342587 /ORGANISM="Karlodinium micrum, Strain CCMP2283" /LENGTH=95 /DNA_ID=CAMNT_0009530291 /DNA_START=195 /DNA_END=479 /DNA_ORIENTATION=+
MSATHEIVNGTIGLLGQIWVDVLDFARDSETTNNSTMNVVHHALEIKPRPKSASPSTLTKNATGGRQIANFRIGRSGPSAVQALIRRLQFVPFLS